MVGAGGGEILAVLVVAWVTPVVEDGGVAVVVVTWAPRTVPSFQRVLNHNKA